ncbi:type II toxin-antitoxin system Phd/YefM family antitoxin [Halomonas tibetensis]|uniref:Antitoxin n=1 Tax=Halomonas tibetensis TaxID=2259590 RepID=A0ABV7BA48_9GAMM
MDTVTYRHFRSHLAKVLDRVNDDHVPVLMTRQNGKPAIVMSVEDVKSYEETAYLMAGPRNAQRLNEVIAEVEQGDASPHDVIES